MQNAVARCRTAVLVALVGVGTLAQAAQVRLPLSGAAGELDGLEVVRWREGASQRVAAEVRRDGDAAWLDVASSCEPGVLFVVTTKRRIGVVDRCGEPLQLALHPRAVLSGRFAAGPSVSGLPAHGIARTSCANVPFSFDSKKNTELSVPADCGVVALHVAKLAPVLVPPDALSTARSHLLGDVFLRHGASLLARVRSASGGEPIAGLIALVLRRGDLERQPGAYNEATLQPLGRGRTDRHGWIAYYGLTPAEVVLALRHPGQRFPQLTSHYVLDPAAGVVLDDLTVPAPATLAVRLDIPEGLGRELALTNVELLPQEDNRWPRRKPISVPAPTDGTPVTLDVPPGAWTIAAMVRLKDGFLSRSASRRLTLAPGAYEDVTLAVRGGLFRGRVVRSDTGLRGVLGLSPADGGGVNATARTNDDGRFTILLEGPGRYTVDFQEAGKGSVHFERYVELNEPSKEVEIRLPSGRIRGRVTYENGVPAAKAGVTATAGEMSISTVTSADGEFTVDSVAEGTWLVSAAAEGASGDPVEVRLLKSSVADGVLLVVRQTAEVGIHVVDAAGRSVADAFVIVELPSRSGGPMSRTNADGMARVRVPASLQGANANAVVSTLDERIVSAIVRLDPERVATVRLAAQTGELRLERQEGPWGEVSMPRLVAEDGSSIPVPTRRGGPAYLSDALVRLSKVPAGRWRYIEARTPLDALAIRALNFAFVQPAAEFTVRPGVANEVEIQY